MDNVDQPSETPSAPAEVLAIVQGSTPNPLMRQSGPSLPITGGRASMRRVAVDLGPEELMQSGVQKMLVDNLKEADERCKELEASCEIAQRQAQAWCDKFHAADKRAGQLEERLTVNKVLEMLNQVGIGVGGVLAGVGFGGDASSTWGIRVSILGVVMIIGCTIAKIKQWDSR